MQARQDDSLIRSLVQAKEIPPIEVPEISPQALVIAAELVKLLRIGVAASQSDSDFGNARTINGKTIAEVIELGIAAARKQEISGS